MKNYTFAPGTAIVTGAASGIGEAVAHQLAKR
jgi:NADP-dependent 3-hydroxy acid dehydrogenase YdfG